MIDLKDADTHHFAPRTSGLPRDYFKPRWSADATVLVALLILGVITTYLCVTGVIQ